MVIPPPYPLESRFLWTKGVSVVGAVFFSCPAWFAANHLIWGTDDQMQQSRGAAAEDGPALEVTAGATRAHPNGAVARNRDDAARDCGRYGCVAKHGEPRAQGGIKALKPKPNGGRKRENMSLAEEKAFLARFATAAGAGEMLNIHDLKAAYEQEIGHQTSDSTIYNLLHRHDWRKLMPRPFHPQRNLKAQNAFKKTAFLTL